MSALTGLLIIALCVALWVNGARAHEVAVAASARGCRERGVQLLDQTVALWSVRLRWTRQGLRLRRIYRFDFSEEGVERRSGHITLVGNRIVELSLGLPGAGEPAPGSPVVPGREGE